MPVVYIDVVWLINLVMDGFILLVTAFLARQKIRWWRMIGASVLGATYALFLFFPQMADLLSFVCKILFSLLMVWIAFRPKGVLSFGKILGLFYLASFVTGGAAYAANAFFQNVTLENGLVLLGGQAVWLEQSSLLLILVALPVVYWLGKSAWKRLVVAKQRERNLWTVEVRLQEQQIAFTGLLDTGNALNDPLSRLPVMVADWELFRELLPQELVAKLQQGADLAGALADVAMEEEWLSKFRLVPYRGVGGTMGMLLAFRPQEVVLTDTAERHACTRVLIGLNPKPLAADGSYRAILHPAMLLTPVEQPDATLAGVAG